MKDIIIAIDGYSGTGKGTVAKQLARRLNYVYVDSGAIYRAITLFITENQIDFKNNSELGSILDSISVVFFFDSSINNYLTFLNGRNVENLIRTSKINKVVSYVSEVKEVRAFAVRKQKELGINKKIVMDGRDIGTNVFPQAELKIFMEASVEARAIRRFKEMKEKNIPDTYENIKQNLVLRDIIDSKRIHDPLIKAADAVIVDNTFLSIDQQFDLCYELALKKINS